MLSHQLLILINEMEVYFLYRKCSPLRQKARALQRIHTPKLIFQCVKYADMVMLANPYLISALDTL